MNARSRRIRRALWLSAAAAAAAALIVPAVTSSVAAQPGAQGPGYPPPGGIYKLFTNCPLNDPLMHEANGLAACTGALATSGSIKLGNLTTTVTEPVNVQFGFWTPPNQTYYADAVPPLAGTAAQLVTKPDLIPESLTTGLGCPSTNATIENMCQQAQQRGGVYNQVYALAQSAGNITNFNLLTWTQPVKFQLINPLLGNNCYVGTNGDPVVLNPSLAITKAKVENDPDPAAHPDTLVLAAKASASDTTFSAPGVTGCGPGGVANIAVDQALDASSGLPAASGSNSLTLTGTFDVGACQASTDSSVPQPADDAAILLSALKASHTGVHGSSHAVTVAEIKQMFGLKG